jgi:hypothetical protein
MKVQSNNQMMDGYKKKIRNQDDQLEELIGITKQGQHEAKELKTELKKQNVQLDDVEKDVS